MKFHNEKIIVDYLMKIDCSFNGNKIHKSENLISINNKKKMDLQPKNKLKFILNLILD